MNLSIRISAFSSMGEYFRDLPAGARKDLAEKARNENPWFTEDNVLLALKGIETLLDRPKLTAWANHYSPEPALPKLVGLAAAGNIPLVGFHDFLCVLMAGHRLKIKLSAQDTFLFKHLIARLIEIEPRFAGRISVVDTVNPVDAMIATGSDNTARYFEYYFRKVPHIIRKNRTSCAVIQGEEPAQELELLGRDVFSYFGLGCRNVSKVFVPEEFEVERLLESWQPFSDVANHHKYANNYDYQKTILLLNQEPFLESEFVLLRESKNLVSPIGVVFYEKYRTLDELKEHIRLQAEKLQVIVSAKGWYTNSVPFGKAQLPELTDYADQVDTMTFLMALK